MEVERIGCENVAMPHIEHLTAMMEPEDDGYVALGPELDIASQGNSVEEASDHLSEVLSLFFENSKRSRAYRICSQQPGRRIACN